MATGSPMTDRRIRSFEKALMELMRSNDPKDMTILKQAISRIAGDPKTRAQYDEITSAFNPLEGVHLNSYIPMQYKEGWTPQQVLKKANNTINLQNIIGDLLQAAGTAGNIKNQALAQGLQNVAATRGQHERELYGANASDYAAALGAPTASGLGNIEQAILGIFADRIHGNAALKRQAEMQAVVDAYNRNVGGSGLFFDARRKMGTDAPATSNIK